MRVQTTKRPKGLKPIARILLTVALCGALLIPGVAVGGVPAGEPLVQSAPGLAAPELAAPATDWMTVSAGANHNLAFKTDGSLWAWGSNAYGQLGNGSIGVSAGRAAPICIRAAADWKEAIAGNQFSLAIKNDGSLWAWGRNDVGQLGDGTTTNRTTPVRIGTANDWRVVAAGSDHSLAMKNDGSLYAWGWNRFGQLGDGTTTDRMTPTRIGTATDWKVIGVSNYCTIALKNDNSLWAWGANFSNAPTRIGTANNWQAISAGDNYFLALQNDGSLWAWGANTYGQLGDGTNVGKPTTPTRIGMANDWKAISAGGDHSLAQKNDGSLYAWGRNDYGQLGDGTTTRRTTPTRIGTASDWKMVSAGTLHSLAMRTNGSLWAWGLNGNNSRLGDGTYQERHTPVRVVTATDWNAVSAGSTHSLAIRNDGSLWAWGDNSYGKLGDGGYASSSTSPRRVGIDNDWAVISAGNNHNLAIKRNGSLYAWGRNNYGQLGDGTTTDRNVPTRIGTYSWKAVSAGGGHSLAISENGSLYAWGNNGNGQLGDGTTTDRNVPTSIGTLQWEEVSAGVVHSLGVRSNGWLYTWGSNQFSQLGDGTTGVINSKSVPTRIGTLSNWAEVSAGGFYSHARQSDDMLWGWGDNDYGQLGDYSTSNRRNPVLVTNSVSTMTSARTISGGSEHAVAITQDGSLWATGRNNYGQLGTASTSARSLSFVRIGSATDWQAVSAGTNHSLAVRGDGSLWAWGANGSGRLGDGTTTDRGAPVQVQAPPLEPDTTPPVTTSDAVASYTGTAVIRLTAADPVVPGQVAPSGVKEIRYRFDSGTEAAVAGAVATVTASTVGTHTLLFWAVDNNNNTEAQRTATFTVGPGVAPDTTPPVTESDAVGSYTGTAVIRLSATDPTVAGQVPPSGVKEVRYKLDSGTEAVVSGAAATVTVSAVGSHTLLFWAVDNNGNTEAQKTANFTVSTGVVPDTTPPVTESDAVGSYTGTAVIKLSATDPTVAGQAPPSGVKEIRYKLDSEAEAVVAGAAATVTASTVGSHTLVFWAVDNNNNTEAQKTASFTVTGGGSSATMPITADVKDRHGGASAPHGAGFDASTAPTVCQGCHSAGSVHPDPDAAQGCVGCHDVSAAPGIVSGTPAPPNHAYIRPGTYGCDGCHAVVEGPAGGSIERVFGSDRFQTALGASKKNFTSAGAVIIATGLNYADALSASALAGSLRAPLLLTAPGALSDGVLDEARRLGATKAYIMGSTAAVSAGVEGSLTGAGLGVERVYGADRYATSAAIAAKVAELEGGAFTGKAFLARGDNFADGLAASPVAYRNKMPVLLTPTAALSPSASLSITSLHITDVTVTGSEAAVSAAAKASVDALPGVTSRRVAGTDRYRTAEEIARYALGSGLAAKGFIGVATGVNFPDALAGGAATGERGGILVLTASDALSPNWDAYLGGGAYAGIRPDIQVYGGSNVVSDNVMERLQAILLD
ncbi:MAG: cell wall-binding repeat-containing protein [Coriobacteriia bacterium]|nr:cell wall-binding repeat-containing protein [Coriobacteriia bacterium]